MNSLPKPSLPTRILCLLFLAAISLTGCHKQHVAARFPAASAPEIAHRSSPRTTPTPHEKYPSPARPEVTSTASPPDHLGKPITTEIVLASWYGPPYSNRHAADGSIFNQKDLTAAHRTLPMGSIIRVTNLTTEQSVVVRITDRGPFIPGRSLDLSLGAAKAIGLYRMGVAKVRVEVFAHPNSDLGGRWCVQIGAFIDPADAIQLKNDLAHRYTTAKVTEFAGPTGHWVRINPARPDHNTAASIADSIHLPDAMPYLIRTK